MAEDHLHAKAQQSIGAYFCAFSVLERELGESIKVIFRLQEHEAGDAIVAALGDVARKIRLVRTAVSVAKRADGSETAEKWKDNAAETMVAIFQCNNDRVALAHSHLQTEADGSMLLARLPNVEDSLSESKVAPVKWSPANFEGKIARLTEVTKQLKQIRDDLSKLKIVDYGWMSRSWDLPDFPRWRPAYDQASTPMVLRETPSKPPSATGGISK